MGIQAAINNNSNTATTVAGATTTTTTAPTKQKLPDVYNLSKIRASLPKEVFEKSLTLSLAYLAKDLMLWGLTIYVYQQLQQTTWYLTTATTIMKIALCLVYWNLAGFWMWCLFVVGHDCGHGTFSTNELLNNIIGHIAHSLLLVPFFPWQLSHQRHHQYHNHKTKDYSFPWYDEDTLFPTGRNNNNNNNNNTTSTSSSTSSTTTAKSGLEAVPEDLRLSRLVHEYPLLLLSLPYVGWLMYLCGSPDGNHFFPLSYQRLWKEDFDNNNNNNNKSNKEEEMEARKWTVKNFMTWFQKINNSDNSNNNNNEIQINTIVQHNSIKCLFSTVAVAIAALLLFQLNNNSLVAVFYNYIGSWFCFSFWLVTVTYLQHHCPDVVVYDDAVAVDAATNNNNNNDNENIVNNNKANNNKSNKKFDKEKLPWNFVVAAFETVDRTYNVVEIPTLPNNNNNNNNESVWNDLITNINKVIAIVNHNINLDYLHHHITDCHVVHHLFFTSIPHYNLPTASAAMQTFIQQQQQREREGSEGKAEEEEEEEEEIYKMEKTSDFFIRVFVYLYCYGLMHQPKTIKQHTTTTTTTTTTTSMKKTN